MPASKPVAKPSPLLGGLANVVLGNVIKQGVAKAVAKVADRKDVPEVKKTEALPITEAVIDELAKDKQFINATNSEPWYQSGVAWGAGTGVAGSLAVVMPALFANGFDIAAYDMATFLPAFITLLGALFTLVRRFVPGWKPMFSSLAK